jgi:hypothetical protein
VPLLEEVAGGLIVETVALMGRRLAVAVHGAGRPSKQDLEIVRWFDTYQLVDTGPPIPLPPPPKGFGSISKEWVAKQLRCPTVHAILQELLAMRLTDAPETEVKRLRDALRTFFESPVPLKPSLLPVGFADLVFDNFDHHICQLVARISTERSQALSRIRNEAFSTRIAAILAAIERHTALIATQHTAEVSSRFRSDRSKFVDDYRRQVREHHGKLQPPDFHRRNRVPIADLYVQPRIVLQTINGFAGSPVEGQVKQFDAIEGFDDAIDRTVLLGDPGGGKTIACKVLMHYYIIKRKPFVPFLIVLRDFAAENPPARSVVGFIEHQLETFYQIKPPQDLVERLLLDGEALVMFDGLDELIDTGHRTAVAEIIELFNTRFPLAPVLVTSREVAYEPARLDPTQFVAYRITAFDEERVEKYVHRWFAQEEIPREEAKQQANAFMDESRDVADLRVNPLMLALMCILYRGEGSIPRNRTGVYEECTKLLLRRWDALHRIAVELEARTLVEPAIRFLAFWILDRESAEHKVTWSELVEKMTEFLQDRRFEDREDAVAAAEQSVHFAYERAWVFSDAGTTAHGEKLYTFTHHTFLEYFAAAHLAYDCDSPEDLANRLATPVVRQEWDMVGQLAVQIKDRTANRGGERIIKKLLDESHGRAFEELSNVLGFLARCLAFTDPSPQLVRALTSQAFDHARANLASKVAFTPLGWLMLSADSTRTDVAKELKGRIGTLIQSRAESDRLTGLRIALTIPGVLQVPANSGVAWAQKSDFWKTWHDELLKSHHDDLIAHLHLAEDLAVLSWSLPYLKIEQIVAAYHGSLGILFRQPHIHVLYSGWFRPIAWDCLRQIIRDTYVGPDPRNTLQVVAKFMAACTDVPRVEISAAEVQVLDLSGYRGAENPSVGTSELSSSYAPAAYLLSVFAEVTKPPEADLEAADLGPLCDFYSYIAQRWA